MKYENVKFFIIGWYLQWAHEVNDTIDELQ